MNLRKIYIHTIGCQMNVYDTGRILSALAPAGYRETTLLEEADLIIVNTCAIRDKAEQKAFSFIGRLAAMKKRRPDILIGVGGCVAQQEGEGVLARMPHVDFVFGTHALGRLPHILDQVKTHRLKVVDVAASDGIDEIDMPAAFHDREAVSRFVTIMQGCDNYCTYCVVPYVRGAEMSRHPDRIVSEIKALVGEGIREVTLLGQNVNSYGRKEGLPSFTDLLVKVNAIEGLRRIRFTTSHPKDLSEDLMAAFANLEKLCPHIHLPVQSGSDKILKRMNRKYTRQLYLDRIARLRQICPDMAVTSDFIVGFPGETRDDFKDTLSLLKTVAFDGAFAFMYSDRKVAPASRFATKVDETEKKERLQELLTTQETITREKNQALVGTSQEILVEGNSTRPGLADFHAGAPQWSGRTLGNKIVNFRPPGDIADAIRIGRMVDVWIDKAYAHSLRGSLLPGNPSDARRGGKESHAA
ncbi:MAG: tRNA (N6-isopentenyl adenosine(37)-C2)-methylthiotransferase MiaB [Desulfobacterales bacterium]|jgi:tRNA-2-methylthio-N6-dimethylallyladenosine synthase